MHAPQSAVFTPGLPTTGPLGFPGREPTWAPPPGMASGLIGFGASTIVVTLGEGSVGGSAAPAAAAGPTHRQAAVSAASNARLFISFLLSLGEGAAASSWT